MSPQTMPLAPLPPTDTRFLFRPVSSALVDLLRTLPPGDWDRPTVAGTWAVRDVVAHLVDLSLRRLSFDRDRMVPPPPPFAITSERDFVRFINIINAEWVGAAKRFSPRVLTDLLQNATTNLSDWFESLSSDAPGLFGVSWAGEQASEGWFDIGREYTELWHHQEQVRMAVGAPSLDDVKFLRPVLEIALRGLPHAFRDTSALPGTTMAIEVSGPAGGSWTLRREREGWGIHEGQPDAPATHVRLTQDAAWKLLFNALRDDAAIAVEGNEDLARPLLAARSIVI